MATFTLRPWWNDWVLGLKASYALAISDASDWTDRIDHVQLIESETRILPAMLQLS